MAPARAVRKLAAILSADAVGYTRLIEQDEAGTRARLNGLLSDLFAPVIGEHGGRIVKTMGDGVLADFASVTEAVECAFRLQTGPRHVRLRAGRNGSGARAGERDRDFPA